MSEPISPGDVLRGQGYSQIHPPEIMPRSLEAEMALLGAMIFKPDVVRQIRGLKPETFAFPAHQTIYKAILSIADQNPQGGIDLVLLKNELAKDHKIESVGGAEYLARLVDEMPTAANAEIYAKIVREKAALRKVIEGLSKIIHEATTISENTDQFISKAYEIFRAFSEEIEDNRLAPVSATIGQTCMNAVEEMTTPKHYTTGIKTLDEIIGGLHPKYYIIGARPKMGKTSLAMNIIEHLAVDKKVPSALITLESTREEIEELFIYSRARIDSQKGLLGKLDDNDRKNLILAATTIYDSPLHIVEAHTADEVHGTIQRLYHEKGVKVFVVDYLQRAVRDEEKENQEIARFSTLLCNLAQKELKTPIIAISQVRKEVESRTDKRPQLADLHGSSRIGADADAVLLLYRDDYYNPQSMTPGQAEINVVQRRGKCGIIHLKWEAEYRRFSPLPDSPTAT
jgi:replicative DNA helicase